MQNNPKTAALRLDPPKPPVTDKELFGSLKVKIDNIAAAWDEFKSGNLSPQTMPFKLIVELTQNCNFKCIMCPQSWEPQFAKYNPELNMPMDVFVKIARELFPAAIFVDLRGFGETTILPYWDDVLDYLEGYPFVDWHLVTNLSVPKAAMWDKMMRLGFMLGFSCDGGTKETFEAIRVHSKFEVIRQNLGVIRDSIKKHNKGLIYFISTIQQRNVHEMRKIVELAAEFSVHEVQFKMVQGGSKWDLYNTDPQIVKKHVEDSIDLALDHGIRVTFNDWYFTKHVNKERVDKAAVLMPAKSPPNFVNLPHIEPFYWNNLKMPEIINEIIDSSRVSVHQKCFKPFSFTYVNYKGEVGTCNHMMFPEMLVQGDLRTHSFKEIWQSEKYMDFRQQLLTATPKDSRCQWCFKHRLED